MSGPQPLWTPPLDLVAQAALAKLIEDVGVDDYEDLWAWSVADVGRFWSYLWRHFSVRADGDPAVALEGEEMPWVNWFPHTRLSYPEHVFAQRSASEPALWHESELRELGTWSWAELEAETARIRAGLRNLGVGQGDRVAAYLPNLPETLAAFLAATSLGAVWSCCSPDFGAGSVVDRFAQIEPKVLLAVDGYRYGGRDFERSATVRELEAALPTLSRTVTLPYLGEEGNWRDAFPETAEPLRFERVPFDHPLWILYSSGTTGKPKAIVHGHGGILIELMKSWALQHDVRRGERVFWFTTTGWMMWNYLVSALLTGAEIVLYDGHPNRPAGGSIWDLAERSGVTTFGCGASFLHGCLEAGENPTAGRDLSRLRKLGSTGSPLAPRAFEWVYESFGQGVWLTSVSGGTDVATALVGACPLVPVYAGEIQARCLGVAVESWDERRRSQVEAVGELVVTKPMPSMPVGLWGDTNNERYRSAYFSRFPGVWRQGDWIRLTVRGSAVIEGRSDATINRGGVRFGTAEIYGAVLELDEVRDAVVVDLPAEDQARPSWMPLFVVLAPGAELDEPLRERIRAGIRAACSPRHVPDAVFAIPEVPRTRTGKILEVPIKRILMGDDPATVASADAMANGHALDWFARFARERRQPAVGRA